MRELRFILREISKIEINDDDNKYKYEIYPENIPTSAAHSNLGSKIRITDINGVTGLPSIEKIILIKSGGNYEKKGSKSGDSIVFNEHIASHGDTIRIITSENIANYIIEFPEANL